jgi:hypothetical protein
MDILKTFIEEKPLYVKYVVTKLPRYERESYPDIVDLECGNCGGVRPFHKSGYNRFSFGIGGTSSSPVIKNKVYEEYYDCTGCVKEKYFFWIDVSLEEMWVQKVGQLPAWSIRPDNNLSKLIPSHQHYYKRGLTCESQGYGIGAHAYYRRIVEEIIDKLLESITDLIEPAEKEQYLRAIEETKKTRVAQEKIALVKDLLPAVLRPDGMNPLNILHSDLSEGLHDATDEECLETAKHIREVLIFLATQIAMHRESSKTFTDSMRRLLQKRSGKENEITGLPS